MLFGLSLLERLTAGSGGSSFSRLASPPAPDCRPARLAALLLLLREPAHATKRSVRSWHPTLRPHTCSNTVCTTTHTKPTTWLGVLGGTCPWGQQCRHCRRVLLEADCKRLRPGDGWRRLAVKRVLGGNCMLLRV
eukprot:363625-Chlamydomonas_euryale.AAC.24